MNKLLAILLLLFSVALRPSLPPTISADPDDVKYVLDVLNKSTMDFALLKNRLSNTMPYYDKTVCIKDKRGDIERSVCVLRDKLHQEYTRV